MSQLFFIFILCLVMAVRPFIAILIVVIRPLVPFIKSRLDFERLNFLEEGCLPFKGVRADYCFEVSSEGELEQVRALLEEALKRKKKIEIIYSSPSVESKCQALYKNHPENIRLLRLPLLSGSPVSFLYFQSVWSWVSAPTVIFCRYDFFPELLLLKLFKKRFVLLSGATKKMSWFKRECFKLFDLIVAATDLEKKNFDEMLGKDTKVYSCDFRVPRVFSRFENAEETLGGRPEIKSLIDHLEKTPANKKIILGSAWASDLGILNHPKFIEKVKNRELFLLLAPHKLDAFHTDELFKGLAVIFGEQNVEVVNKENSFKGAPVVILQLGGILCEMYSLFSAAYVGGGYERSIHSVLEPFFSYNVVALGPVIHRSTEFDLAHELIPSEIHVLKDKESFYNVWESIDFRAIDLKSRQDFVAKTDQEMQLIFKDILG